MPRKKSEKAAGQVTGGSHTLAARGLTQFVVTATPEAKRKMAAAAALDGKPLSKWASEQLELLAIKRLTEA